MSENKQKENDYHADTQQEPDIILMRLTDKKSVARLHETLFDIFGE